MTTFQGPLKSIGLQGDTGNTQTETSGYMSARKQVVLGGALGNTRKIVTLPPKSTLIGVGFVNTSAFTGDTAASAMVVSFGNSADATHYATFNVSGGVAQRFSFVVSAGAEFDTGGPVIVQLSALSTTTYVGGGRAFVEYVATE